MTPEPDPRPAYYRECFAPDELPAAALTANQRRLMQVVADPAQHPDARREAAAALGLPEPDLRVSPTDDGQPLAGPGSETLLDRCQRDA
jgi:hypothetical protein